MDIGVISVRYARALLKGATGAKAERQVYDDMQTLAESFRSAPLLRQALAAPMLPNSQKEQLLRAACGKTPNVLTQNFLRLVIKEQREQMVQFIAHSYITLYRKQKNLISGRLITASAVTPETEQKMRQMVESRTKGTVEFQTEVNPDIIGGFILEYDTYRMDGSVKTQLRQILSTLKK
jgi:F-type H+-transporting ATPase subunit delta